MSRRVWSARLTGENYGRRGDAAESAGDDESLSVYLPHGQGGGTQALLNCPLLSYRGLLRARRQCW